MNIRATQHNGEWYLCLNDVIVFLTASKDPAQYWRKMRSRARTEEWEETAQEVIDLPIPDKNGRLQSMKCANQRTLLRLIQGIPGARAERFKLMLAELGDAFFSYVQDRTQVVELIKEDWRKKGRDEEWIEAWIQSKVVRNEWTDELKLRGIDDSRQFAFLTNRLHELTFDISIREHKKLKNLPVRANLRDHETPLELLIGATSEAAATEAHRERDSHGFDEIHRDVVDASEVGRAARHAAEKMLKKPVVSSQNYLNTGQRKTIKAPKTTPNHEQMSLFNIVDADSPLTEG
jgi:hypothetical protein